MSVYFITCRDLGVVKIGHANNPYARINNIRVACPVDVELELILEGGSDEERALHRQLADYRVRGEWFLITQEIEALIARPPLSAKDAALGRPIGELDPHERLERLEAEDWLSGRRVAEKVGNWRRLTRERIIARKLAKQRSLTLPMPNTAKDEAA